MTPTTISFRRTGHFWNDMGVLALWRWLADTAPEIMKTSCGTYVAVFGDTECTLHPDELQVSGDEPQIYNILRQAADALRTRVWRQTKSGKMWWAGPSQFLYAGQNNPDFIAPYEHLTDKPQWRRKGQCSVCGSDTSPVRTAGVVHNPLLVSVEKMSGFYSELKGRYEICRSCAFTAIFALTQLWFSWGDEFLSLNLLWPAGANFLTLDGLLRKTSHLRVVDGEFRNYQQAFGFADTPVACFLDLMCSFWGTSRTHHSAGDLLVAFADVQFYAMQMSKPNKRSNVISVDRCEVIPDPAGVMHLVQSCDRVSKQGEVWNVLVSIMRDMPVKRRDSDGRIQADPRLLGRLADAIVRRAPIEHILEARTHEAINQLSTDAALLGNLNVLAFRAFPPIYFKEVKDVNADLLDALQSVGGTLGELIHLTDDRSILYSLRNSRNGDDLLETLSRVVVRYADAFIGGRPELWRNRVRELAESIDNSNWRRARSLLSLYAGLRLIELSRKDHGKQPHTASS